MARAAVTRLDAQHFREFEVVVVDDGSTDGTDAVLADLVSARVRYMRQPNQGLCAARNAALRIARGQYVVFLDDDDPPHPELLARFASIIRQGSPGVISCATALVLPDGSLDFVTWPQSRGPEPGDFTVNHLPGAFAARRDLLQEIGGYAPGLQSHHQAELMLRLLPLCQSRGVPVVPVYEILMQKAHLPLQARREHQPAQLLAGMQQILGAHGSALKRSPGLLADYHAIAGVAAVRCGQLPLARRHLRAALRARPSPRALIRLCAAWSPWSERAWMYA